MFFRYAERSHLGSRGRSKGVTHVVPRTLVPSVAPQMVLSPAPAMILRQPMPYYQDMAISNGTKRKQPTEVRKVFNMLSVLHHLLCLDFGRHMQSKSVGKSHIFSS